RRAWSYDALRSRSFSSASLSFSLSDPPISSLKFRMALPMPRPRPGNRFAPKITITMARMISSSGIPIRPMLRSSARNCTTSGGERPPRDPDFESLYESPLQLRVGLSAGHEIGHHGANGGASPEGVQQLPDENRAEKSCLELCRAPQLGERFVVDLLDIGAQRVGAARQHVGNPAA